MVRENDAEEKKNLLGSFLPNNMYQSRHKNDLKDIHKLLG